MQPAPAVVAALLLLLSACGSAPDDARATAAPADPAAPSVSAPAPTQPGPVHELTAAPDPCTLLTPAQLAPVLGTTPAEPTPQTGDGQRACAWGDGEFHGVQLSMTEEGPAQGRAVDVGGRPGVVEQQDEYMCQVQVHTGGLAVSTRAIASGGAELCRHAATELDAALDTAGW
ncbi:DUF3558 family protein [Actinokineospora bangkokensis]|uniref:DUF3558 domain-containing protein n=1 Tax=Actinokineospora bangkokensis TaxID=1193682 RepID=A0A1Q9LQD2_9PSEU|nr:DUF3558 family protein [Actinokineospora bangkokensis]OLR94257.1 hypothetical protein BJP25_10760 [Actinokineospora bangkokensis]